MARAYVAAVGTYTPATYTAAVTAAGLTTPALAARSRPSADAADQVATADQTSAVRVTGAGLDPEAANTRATTYVSVSFVASVTYRGAGSGQAVHHVWALRLARHGRRWLVDAVLAAD